MYITTREALEIASSIDLPYGYKCIEIHGYQSLPHDMFRIVLEIPDLPDSYKPGENMKGFTFARNIRADVDADGFLKEFTKLVMLAVCHEVFEKCSKAGTQLMDPHPTFSDSPAVTNTAELGAFWDIQAQLVDELVEGVCAISPPHKPECKLCHIFYIEGEGEVCDVCMTSSIARDMAREMGLIMVPLEVISQ